MGDRVSKLEQLLQCFVESQKVLYSQCSFKTPLLLLFRETQRSSVVPGSLSLSEVFIINKSDDRRVVEVRTGCYMLIIIDSSKP